MELIGVHRAVPQPHYDVICWKDVWDHVVGKTTHVCPGLVSLIHVILLFATPFTVTYSNR